MLQALKRLQRLWYLILILAAVSLIADITFASTSRTEEYDMTPLPMVPDVLTLVIFAYGLWGKQHPFLLPSSSPRSNVCTRWSRHGGTLFLTALWMMNAVLKGMRSEEELKVLAGFNALEAILVLMEMVASRRIALAQRRILKMEEGRKKKGKGEDGDSMNGKGSAISMTGSSVSKDRGRTKDDDDQAEGEELEGVNVEIVRPEAVDPSVLIFSQQQFMFDQYQKLYQQQQYQLYLSQQASVTSSLQAKGDGDMKAGIEMEDKDNPDGKYDDLRIESSLKFEVPKGEEDQHPLTGPSKSSANSPTSSLPSASISDNQLRPPSSHPTLGAIRSLASAPPWDPSSSSTSNTTVHGPQGIPRAPQDVGIVAAPPHPPRDEEALSKA